VPKATDPKDSSLQCGKACIATLVIIATLLILLLVFYEPTPTAGDMCKIYG
jgi:hypothetical protein